MLFFFLFFALSAFRFSVCSLHPTSDVAICPVSISSVMLGNLHIKVTHTHAAQSSCHVLHPSTLIWSALQQHACIPPAILSFLFFSFSFLFPFLSLSPKGVTLFSDRMVSILAVKTPKFGHARFPFLCSLFLSASLSLLFFFLSLLAVALSLSQLCMLLLSFLCSHLFFASLLVCVCVCFSSL